MIMIRNGKKYLSVMSDDFGLSEPINRGIKDSFEKGILTDASLISNAPAFEEAVDIANTYRISIAAHVNLVRGKMLTGANFPDSVLTLWKNTLTENYLPIIEKEARAQIEKILRAGLKINQLNSEKHSHFFPTIFKLWVRLAQEYEIPHMRFIREFNTESSIQGAKANLLSLFSLANRKYLNESSVTCTDYFAGIRTTGSLDTNKLISILENIGPGWTELIVHVGYSGGIDPSMGTYFLQESRERELHTLTDSYLADRIAAQDIILRDFGGRHGK